MKQIFTIVSALVVLPMAAIADAPNVRTPAPVIYLDDNLDEADGLGWCIDTVGRGFSDRMHAHSCKPRGGDVQFRFDAGTGHIASVAFEGKCAEVESGGALRLLDCGDQSAQEFDYNSDQMRFHPKGDTSLCLAVESESRSAGPFMSRDLRIEACSEEGAKFQTWVVAE